jgi:hypothetical protein
MMLKRIQIHFSDLIISLLLMFVGCAVVVAQTKAPVQTITPGHAMSHRLAIAASFELVADRPMGVFNQMADAKPPATAVTLSGGNILQPLFEWHRAMLEGRAVRRSVTIIARSADGREIERYNLTKAFPTRLIGSPLKPGASGAFGSVELAYEDISIAK